MRHVLVGLTLWLSLGAPGVRAATLRVDPFGDFPTIQSAIDSASAGDTLALASATYTENPLIVRKDLVLRADHPGGAILDGAPGADRGNAGNTLRTVSSRVVLDGLVLRNGVPTVGAGIMAFSGQVLLRRCVVENNLIGVLSVPQAIPAVLDLEDCTVRNNGVGIEGSAFTRVVRSTLQGNRLALRTQGEVELRDLDVMGNGRESPQIAGALALGFSFGSLTRVRVVGNWSNNQVGGIFMSFGPFTLTDCRVENNVATNGSAGIILDQVNDGRLRRCTIRHNRGRGPVAATAGLMVLRSSVQADSCVIEHNDGEDAGAGLSVQDGSSLRFTQGWVVANTTGNRGGGIFVSQSAVQIQSSVIAGNRAEAGGAVATESNGRIEIVASTLAGNQAMLGAALFAFGGPVGFRNTILAFHAGERALFCATSSVTFACSDRYANGRPADPPCGVDLGSNFAVDPLFCDFDAAAGRYDVRLRSDSPLAPGDVGSCGPLGARGVGCEATRAETSTWSVLKQRYR